MCTPRRAYLMSRGTRSRVCLIQGLRTRLKIQESSSRRAPGGVRASSSDQAVKVGRERARGGTAGQRRKHRLGRLHNMILLDERDEYILSEIYKREWRPDGPPPWESENLTLVIGLRLTAAYLSNPLVDLETV